MTDREKLVDLLEATTYEALGGSLVVKGFATAKEFADHLIANGVTVQTPKTDLTGKCGSCAHARPSNAFNRSKCYVACTNPEKRFKGAVAHLRQRTCKACKMYKPLPEAKKEDNT